MVILLGKKTASHALLSLWMAQSFDILIYQMTEPCTKITKHDLQSSFLTVHICIGDTTGHCTCLVLYRLGLVYGGVMRPYI